MKLYEYLNTTKSVYFYVWQCSFIIFSNVNQDTGIINITAIAIYKPQNTGIML